MNDLADQAVADLALADLPDPRASWEVPAYHLVAVARDVLTSAEGRSQLPRLIEEIASYPDVTVELGRQRRREVVLVSAARYDEMLEREQLIEHPAWAAFAEERIEHPQAGPSGGMRLSAAAPNTDGGPTAGARFAGRSALDAIHPR